MLDGHGARTGAPQVSRAEVLLPARRQGVRSKRPAVAAAAACR